MSKEKITLDNICGYKDEKDAVKKIITLLKDYDKYSKQGVSIPRGLILQGPPGTGKTLFAKAIAGECGYTFYTAFSTELEEESLATVKKTFAEAEAESDKTGKPALIYIDELDKLTYTNSYGELADKSSRECTRFLLQKLDETKLKNKILIIASTNDYGKIPYALLRSGRFDKKILIELPDKASREEILKFYINKHPLFKNIDVRILALKTAGLSGADLKTLINNTLVEYITVKKHIEDKDFIKIINEMHFETIGKKWENVKIAKKILAHEVGHSIVSGVLTGDYGTVSAVRYGDVQGNTSLGEDVPWDDDEDKERAEEYTNSGTTVTKVLNEIRVGFGGMAGEEVLLHEKSLGVLGGDADSIQGAISFIFDSGVYGFKYTNAFGPYGKTDKFLNTMSKAVKRKLNQLYRETKRIIRKYKYFAFYLIEEIHKNNDVLSAAEIKIRADFYKANKKLVDKEYRKYKI